MPRPTLTNVKTPPATTSGAFGFFSTTLSPTPGKGEDHGFVYHHVPSFKPHRQAL